MLVDVHCHLDFPQFNKDREEVIKKAADAGIIIINSGLGPESIRYTLKLAEDYSNVLATLGISASELDEKLINETIKLIKENKEKIHGIGEVGLDYYWVKKESQREEEKENFRKFIQLADELNLPLVVHSREAESDVLDLLEDESIPVLLHCFGGSMEEVERAISLGYLISIPTSVIYSKHKQKITEKIPMESIVLETDAPYQPPKPRTRNEPINIKESIEKIAKIKSVNKEIVEMITTENAKDFFNIEI